MSPGASRSGIRTCRAASWKQTSGAILESTRSACGSRAPRKELGWKGPHLHFAAGQGQRAALPRAPEAHVDGLARAAVPSERHALLEAAWAGGAGRDCEVETRVEGLAREAAEALAQDAAQRARKQERRWRPGWVTS